MINLQLKADFPEKAAPFVVKICVAPTELEDGIDQDLLALTSFEGEGIYACRSRHGNFTIYSNDGDPIDGDVLLCHPGRNVAQRLFRRASKHNTLLFTERCDQLCVMCSQPPRNTYDEWRFPLYEQALHLVDPGAVIGISGGEPTLFKDPLLDMIDRVHGHRPDISYHILSNGQHFSPSDRERLTEIHKRVKILWGIPIYSHNEANHDKIVGKDGAFNPLMRNLFLLGSTAAHIELRTVITALNVFDLPHIATFIGKHLPFITDWAIMGMEPIGYARANFKQLFFDHSAFPQPIVSTIQISELRGIPCHLYNIPLCTVPKSCRPYCVDSISDWKKKYLPECESCVEKVNCSGFFEWYNDKWSWSGISPITDGGEER